MTPPPRPIKRIDRQGEVCYKGVNGDKKMLKAILSKTGWWWRNFIGGVCLLP